MSKELVPTIGLEIHAQLRTRTKMFCSSKNDPDEAQPNVNICPVCMGHPGTLPVINKEAVKHILKVGLAVGGTLADHTLFDRKNYFYPDIPKGYQISQYKHPLVSGGELDGVTLTRIHLEEDTGRSQHSGDFSLVDFNRAGIPLMELVTEPEITSAKQAADFARELQLLLRTLGVAEVNMEKGEMRIEANVSVAPEGERGTKVEVKNLNSFRWVEKAIEYEINRQREVVVRGENVAQETRGWDEIKEVTVLQRVKETSQDYRYFPDPDLPSLVISEVFDTEEIQKEIPELPWEKRERYIRKFELKEQDAGSLVFDEGLSNLFDEVSEILKEKSLIKIATNYITSDLVGLRSSHVKKWKFDARQFSELIRMIDSDKLSSRGAKDILALMYDEGGEPKKHADEHSLTQKNDTEEIAKIAKKVLDKNPDAAKEYQSGKKNVLEFLIGEAMRESAGSANPGVLKEAFLKELE